MSAAAYSTEDSHGLGESTIHQLLTLAVIAGIGAVAYADYLVITISLGYLYVLPLSLSALIHRLRTTLVFVLVCVVLHDWLGPFEHEGAIHVWNNLLTVVGFSTVVLFVNRLTAKRRSLDEIIRRQRDELAGEIRLAAQVQQRLLPQAVPESARYEFAATMETARAVGGDYYDFVPLPDGRIGVVIADVAGKGVAAALLMASVEMALRVNAPHARGCNDVAQQINRHLHGVTEADRYVTMFYAVLPAGGDTLAYCNAGHWPPLLVRQQTGACEWLETGGPVLGLLPDAGYASGESHLRSGDVLVFYTDGVTEAADATGGEFSKERLEQFVQENRSSSAAHILDGLRVAVAGFSQSVGLADDLTLVVVKVRE